jgi:hypothetical protein
MPWHAAGGITTTTIRKGVALCYAIPPRWGEMIYVLCGYAKPTRIADQRRFHDQHTQGRCPVLYNTAPLGLGYISCAETQSHNTDSQPTEIPRSGCKHPAWNDASGAVLVLRSHPTSNDARGAVLVGIDTLDDTHGRWLATKKPPIPHNVGMRGAPLRLRGGGNHTRFLDDLVGHQRII